MQALMMSQTQQTIFPPPCRSLSWSPIGWVLWIIQFYPELHKFYYFLIEHSFFPAPIMCIPLNKEPTPPTTAMVVWMRSGPYRFMYLDTCSPVSDAVWEVCLTFRRPSLAGGSIWGGVGGTWLHFLFSLCFLGADKMWSFSDCWTGLTSLLPCFLRHCRLYPPGTTSHTNPSYPRLLLDRVFYRSRGEATKQKLDLCFMSLSFSILCILERSSVSDVHFTHGFCQCIFPFSQECPLKRDFYLNRINSTWFYFIDHAFDTVPESLPLSQDRIFF